VLGKVQGEAVQGHSKGEAEEKGRLTDSEDGWGVENLRNPRSGRPLIRFPPDVAHEYMPERPPNEAIRNFRHWWEHQRKDQI